MPAGRPKGSKTNRIWADAISKALAQSEEGKPQKIRDLADKLITMALDGDMQAMKEIGDRVDGKALAEVNITGGIDITGLPDKDLDQRIEELGGSPIPRPENRAH